MDSEETANQSAEDKQTEDDTDVAEDELSGNAHQNQVLVTLDSKMDVKNGNESCVNDQTPTDSAEATEEDSSAQKSVKDGEAEREMKQVVEDGGEEILIETGSYSPAANISLEVPGHLTDMETTATGAEEEQKVELTAAETVQSVRDEYTDFGNMNVDGGCADEDNEDRSEELDLPVVSDTIPVGQEEEEQRKEEDIEIFDKQKDVKEKEQNENESMCPDGSNSSIYCEECTERQDDSGNVLAFNNHEASLIAQDLVHGVLDKVLRAEDKTEEKGTDHDIEEDRCTAQFPELEKVDLSSDDWDHDFHAKGNAAHDNISLSSSENDKDRLPLESDMVGDSEENENEKADFIKISVVSDGGVDPILSDKNAQLHGSMYQLDTEGSHSAQHLPKSLDEKINQKQVETSSDSCAVSSGKVALPSVPVAVSSSPASLTQSALVHYTSPEQASEQSGQVEESKDGSYLWLQQQTQWRASSKELPRSKFCKETTSGKHDNAENCPRSKLERDSLGGVESLGKNVVSDERTRMSPVSRSAEVSSLLGSPGAIPNFKTLQDQQKQERPFIPQSTVPSCEIRATALEISECYNEVSWLSMYRMLEDQHRGELRAQYNEHQRMISDMQRQLEGELVNQQLSVQQKLQLHRQALREQTSRTGYTQAQGRSDSWITHSADTSMDVQVPNKSSSHIMQSTNMQERLSWRPSQDNPWSRTEIGDKKQLCGGVYSSPMPLSKSKKHAEAVGAEAVLKQFDEESAKRSNWSQHAEHTFHASQAIEQEQVISPRTRLSLKEKHAKHMADLRTYYEAEIQDLRHKLSTSTGSPVHTNFTAGCKETAKDRILQEENQTLRQQLRNLQDALDDAHIYKRELEQKLQGLEIRAADYCERYQESQHNVLKLKNRLEELHSYAQDRESVLEQMQSAERRQAVALQETQKAQEDLTETALKDKSALKMLLDKYGMLEKDYTALRESATDFEKKLFETRKETVELNKTISQLELENKRLRQENSNMCHRLAINSSFPVDKPEVSDLSKRKDYCDDFSSGHMSNGGTGTARSPEREDRMVHRRVTYDDEDCEREKKFDSPLLRAEHELRRLQQTMGRGDFVPLLQPKKYTSSNNLGSVNDDVVIIDAFTSPTRGVNNSKPEGKKRDRMINSAATGERGSGGQSRTAHNMNPNLFQADSLSSPTRFDVGVQQKGSRSPASGIKRESGTKKEQTREKEHTPATNSTANTEAKQSVDSTLERIRGGVIVSRPKWEDVYTSLAKPQQPDNKMSSLNMTQEEMLRDRVRSISQIEHRYDTLQVEKKNLESKLNKVPSHGRDRKTRREKELLEEKLDSVDHELGSLRMTLKRYQVLKTTI